MLSLRGTLHYLVAYYGEKREYKKNLLEGEEMSLCGSQKFGLGKGKEKNISEGSGAGLSRPVLWGWKGVKTIRWMF